MKRLRNLCIAIIALVGLSSSAFADGTTPLVGATHTYEVTSHTGSTYAWSVTTDYQGMADVDSDPLSANQVVNFSATTGNLISITWVNPDLTRTDPYFVHVIETITATGCSNHKVMAVVPVNGFDMVIASVDADDANLTDHKACAPNVIVTGFTPAQDFTYDYGENTFYYKITASGIGSNGWSPQFTIAGTDNAATYTAGWATAVDGTYTAGLDVAGGVNDIDVAGNIASVWVKVTVDNTEGLADNPITVTLLDGADTSEDANGNDVNAILAADEVRIQTVQARPSTSGITTN